MKKRIAIVTFQTLAAFTFLLPITAYTMPILTLDDSGNLSGAKNVNVSDTLYDVSFVDGSFDSIFGSDTNLDARSNDEATAFSLALNNQVFLDVSSGNYNTEANLTNGCNFRFNTCSVITPYEIDLTFASIVDAFHGRVTGVDRFRAILRDKDTTLFPSTPGFDDTVFADWSVAGTSVPLPGALGLFSFGLAGLLGLFHRRST